MSRGYLDCLPALVICIQYLENYGFMDQKVTLCMHTV